MHTAWHATAARAGFQKPSDSGKAEAVTGNVPFHSPTSQIQNLRGCPVWGGRKGGRRAGRTNVGGEVGGEVEREVEREVGRRRYMVDAI